MSIFVPSALVQPIALCLFDSKPATSGFISQSISTPVQFSDESTQTLELLVTKLHPTALIVLRLPWLRSTNPIIDWSTLSLAFQTGPKSTIPAMTVAMSCTTSALHHEDIISNLSPMFASIPELCTPGTSSPSNLSADSSNVASISHPVDSSNVADTPHPVDSSNVADSQCLIDSSHVADLNTFPL